MSMAAGNAALNFVARNNIREYTMEMGRVLLDGLNDIMEESEYIGDVRGLGLMVGVEYVKDRRTKAPFNEFCVRMRKDLFENGILIEIGGHHANVIRILPPLITTRRMIDTFLDIFSRVNRSVEKLYAPVTDLV